MSDDHYIAEEFPTEDGYRAVCGCGFYVARGSLADARSDLRGHIEVAKLRAALKGEADGMAQG